MITDLWIENFKGIGKRQHIPLRPITLLFGANSAGKSTVLHALLYLRECLCSNNPDPRKPIDGEHSVNLGGFANILHSSTANSLSIAATVDGGGADYNESYYLVKNRHERGFSDDESPRFPEPLQIDEHRSGFSSTGLFFHKWEPKSTIELKVQSNRMSRMNFSFDGCSGVSIWREDELLNEKRLKGKALHTQPSFSRILAWINPWCGSLYPEHYEAMGRKLTLDESHALITEKGAKKRAEFFATLNDCFESLCSNHEEDAAVPRSPRDWLISSSILDIPTPPAVLPSIDLLLLSVGNLIPLHFVLDSVAKCTGAVATPALEIDRSGFYVWFVRNVEGFSDSATTPVAFLSSQTSRTTFSEALGAFRFVCTKDPLCQSITLSRYRDIVPDETQPLDFDMPLISDRSEAGLCYLSERQALIDELVRGSISSLKYSLRVFTYVGPKRSTVPRNLNSDVMDEFSSWGDGLGAWRWMLHCSVKELETCAMWLDNVAIGLGTGFSLCRRILYEVDRTILDVVVEGIRLSDQLDEEQADKLEADLETSRSFMKISLVDRRTNGTRHPQEVGEGVTQVIPVIAALVRATSTEFSSGVLTAIEQPELHLHPSLAARVGDLAVATMLKSRSRVALVETHSEHLILRILRRIRQTTDNELPEHIPPVKADDVCVLWVDNLGDGTTIQRLRIDDQGEFIDRWPQGFFRERAEELY